MPTYTTTTLDRLIESGGSKSMTTARNVPAYKQERTERVSNSKHERRNTISTTTTTQSIDQKHPWVRITPALYATPEPTPLPDSPSSFPPSPYIINHKRRGPRLLKQMVEVKKVDQNGKSKEEDAVDLSEAEKPSSSFPASTEAEQLDDMDNNMATQYGLVEKNCEPELGELRVEVSELDDFFDPQDSMSAKSNSEGEGGNSLDRSLHHSMSAPMAEFYDAWEELSTESGPQPLPRDIEAELREMRLSLLTEIEKRKQAEEVLESMRTQWLEIREQLALVGIKLPVDLVVATDAEQLDLNEEMARQIYIARFVSNSIGRGIAKAEVEMEMEAQIDLKNFEISRLCDRLQYYEAVNKEMSQRNQETIETARRLRQKRKKRQMWIWGAIVATITLGSGALVWSYVSTEKESSSTTDSHAQHEHDLLQK